MSGDIRLHPFLWDPLEPLWGGYASISPRDQLVRTFNPTAFWIPDENQWMFSVSVAAMGREMPHNGRTHVMKRAVQEIYWKQ